MTKPSLIPKQLLTFVVAYRIHCYKNLVKHEQMMTKPVLDIVISQFARLYNNPDMLSALALCWPFSDDNTLPAKEDEQQERMANFIKCLYGTQYDQNLHFNEIYPTRTTPLNQTLNKRRSLALKQSLMHGNQLFMSKLTEEIKEVE